MKFDEENKIADIELKVVMLLLSFIEWSIELSPAYLKFWEDSLTNIKIPISKSKNHECNFLIEEEEK